MQINKKGAALLQVLLVTAVLAGLATMVLRASLSRTSSGRTMRRAISEEMLLESCMAEVNMMWNKKSPEVLERDLAGCWMNCNITIANENATWLSSKNYTSSKCYSSTNGINTSYATRSYTCSVPTTGENVSVTTTLSGPTTDGSSAPSLCKLTLSLPRENAEQL